MKAFVLALIIMLSTVGKAQDTLVTYYDKDWKKIEDKGGAVYFGKLYKVAEDTWEARDYFISGEIQMTGQYYTSNAKKRKGSFIYYYKNGQVKNKGVYKEGKKDGEWVNYFENGDLKGKTEYENGKMLTSRSWDEDGKEVYDVAGINPEYPGGDEAMAAFINSNFKYPEDARENGEQGTIYISFVVTNEGNLEEIEVIKGVSTSLDKECIRVISAMPKWKPGEQEGRPVHVRYTIPIRARLALSKAEERKIKRKKKKNKQ